MRPPTPGSDPIYKSIYSFADMVEDLLRSVLPKETIDAVDWATLEQMPTEHVGEDFRRRIGDSAWRVRLRPPGGGWLHVVVLLEFQATNDRVMALRVMEYAALVYLELAKQDQWGSDRRLPPVLPVVLYNGEGRWTAARNASELVTPVGMGMNWLLPSQGYAMVDLRREAMDDMGELTRAVALLERSRSAGDLARVARLLAELLRPAAREELRRVFGAWLWVLLRRLESPGEKPLAPPPELTLEDVGMTLEERVARWHEPYVRQGIERGVEQGLERGLEQQRSMLRRLAAARFDEETADRLFVRLREEESQEGLSKLGEAIVRSETGDELLRQTGS